jgi:tetratricopeptide (TPR) repeat protein
MVQDEPAAAVDPAFERELAEFEAKLAANAHAFAIFDLDLDADRKSIRARWGQLSSRFHPDRLGPEGLGHLRSRVEPVFAALSEAHGVLSNQSEREELRRVIEAGGEPGKPGQDARSLVRNALEAEMLSRDADKLLKAGNFVRALELYERALALHPGEAEIQAAAAWCRYQVDGRTEAAATAALEILARAVDEQPKCARAHFYRGLVFLQQRQESAATRSFEDALKADRRFTDAERQLRALQLKKRAATEEREPAAKKKGGLRGLFTRKD